MDVKEQLAAGFRGIATTVCGVGPTVHGKGVVLLNHPWGEATMKFNQLVMRVAAVTVVGMSLPTSAQAQLLSLIHI